MPIDYGRPPAEALVPDFKNLHREMDRPRRPDLIRQMIVGCLASRFADTHQDLVELRRKMVAGQYPESVVSALDAQIADLGKIKSALTKMRDNPSQKMADRLDSMLPVISQIMRSLTEMLALARDGCKKEGWKFYHRCGYEID